MQNAFLSAESFTSLSFLLLLVRLLLALAALKVKPLTYHCVVNFLIEAHPEIDFSEEEDSKTLK